jgi:hypothetical protein
MIVSSNLSLKKDEKQLEHKVFTPRTTFEKILIDDKFGNMKDFKSTIFGRINEVNQLLNALKFDNNRNIEVIQDSQTPQINKIKKNFTIQRKTIPKTVYEGESSLINFNPIRKSTSFKTINYSISDLSGKIKDLKANPLMLSNMSKIKIKSKAPSSKILIDISKKLLNNDPLVFSNNSSLPTISESVKNARDKLNQVIENTEKVIEKHYKKNLNILSKNTRKFELPQLEILNPEIASLKNEISIMNKKKIKIKKFTSMKDLAINFKEKLN